MCHTLSYMMFLVLVSVLTCTVAWACETNHNCVQGEDVLGDGCGNDGLPNQLTCQNWNGEFVCTNCHQQTTTTTSTTELCETDWDGCLKGEDGLRDECGHDGLQHLMTCQDWSGTFVCTSCKTPHALPPLTTPPPTLAPTPAPTVAMTAVPTAAPTVAPTAAPMVATATTTFIFIGGGAVLVLGMVAWTLWKYGWHAAKEGDLARSKIVKGNVHSDASSVSEARSIDVEVGPYCFLSLRFTDKAVRAFAGILREALEKRGHKVFLCEAGVGDQYGPRIRNALAEMTYFVPFITLDPMYGADSGGQYTTYFELQFALEQRKKIVPIAMYEGSWPPTQLQQALRDAGDIDGAGMVAFAFLPALVAQFAPTRGDWTRARAEMIADKIVQSTSA